MLTVKYVPQTPPPVNNKDRAKAVFKLFILGLKYVVVEAIFWFVAKVKKPVLAITLVVIGALVGCMYGTKIASAVTTASPEKVEEVEKAGKAKKQKKIPILNEAAMDDTKVRDYIMRFHDVAQMEMSKFKVPASIQLAQGILESSCGTSPLCRNANNHFGIKGVGSAGSYGAKDDKWQLPNGSYVHQKSRPPGGKKVKSGFRKYKTAWESWRDHTILLSNDNYGRLKRHGMDYRKWAYGLKACKYATDPEYAQALIGLIERYELHRYDNVPTK